MVSKLKLKLKASEVIALTKLLASELSKYDVQQLRDNPSDMLILSAVYEIYAKVKEQAENIRVFGGKRKETLYSVSITRTQALAIACLGYEVPESKNTLQTYEDTFIVGLIGTIHQTFLV